jgi:flagellin
MPLVINTNVPSLNSQRQLVKSGDAMNTAMERLSSGQRINSAADDAAGLAISNRQSAQIRGLNQAVRNANDGISLIQTAEGALSESTNILQRMRELSVQSANGIYSDTDRATLNAETQQLVSELDRIADSTSFNGQKLLDGSLGNLALQIGSQANQTIGVSVGAVDTKSLGGAAGGDVIGAETTSTSLLAGLKTINGGTEALSINSQNVGDLTTAATLNDALKTINENVAGVEVGAVTEMVAGADGTGVIRGGDILRISLANADGTSTTLEITDTGSMEELVSKINAGGGDLEASLNDDGRLALTSASGAGITVNGFASDGITAKASVATAVGFTDGESQQAQLTFTITDSSVENIDLGVTTADAAAFAGATGVQARTDGDITGAAITTATNTTFADGDISINGVAIDAFTTNADSNGDLALTAGEHAQGIADAINAQSTDHGVVASLSNGALVLNSVDGSEIKLELNGAAAVMANTGLVETNNVEGFGNNVANIDISTQGGAQKAIETIDKALDQVNNIRSDLGATSNRLDFTVSNLMNISENTSAARSRIMDADFAAETANLSRAQVLQQASQAMLAQANAKPQQVLSLLQ